MCTFKDERAVVVCDVAIGAVREAVDAEFEAAVRYTPVAGEGTLVEAGRAIDVERFTALVRTAIVRAQDSPPARG